MSRIGETTPYPEWRQIVDRCRQLEYGEVVPHNDLAACAGLTYGTQRYYAQVRQAVKVLLREHDTVVVSLPRIGYKRLEPDQHGRESRRYVRLGTRRIKRGARVASVTDISRLSGDAQRELEKSMVMMRALSEQMGQLYRSMKGVLPPVQAPLMLSGKKSA